MSGTEESPAQKSARLRRERREAKIKAGGSARLDRITGVSGRPQAASTGEERSASPSAAGVSATPPTPQEAVEPGTQSASASASASPSPSPSQPQPQLQAEERQQFPSPRTPNLEDQTPENIRAQEEYLRAMLRSQQLAGGRGRGGGGGDGGTGSEQNQQDPTAKLLGALLGANPAAASGGSSGPQPSTAGEPGAGGPGGIPELSPNDLTSALGIPPSVASFFSRQTRPESRGEQTRNWVYKVVHLVFAVVVAGYILFTFSGAVRTFGTDPPPPSTAWDPWVVFATGEVVLTAVRVGRGNSSKDGGQGRSIRTWVRVFGDVLQDAKIVVFVLGIWALLAEKGFTDERIID